MQAINMAKAIADEDTYCHALNNVGTTEARIPASRSRYKKNNRKSGACTKKILIMNMQQEAYTNIISPAIKNRDYDVANEYLDTH